MPRDRRQLSLFGEPPEPVEPPRTAVGPAEPSAELLAIARALRQNLRLGTSSWSFSGWTGLVYDRDATAKELATDGLAAYARHPLLRAVGIDRTYYAPLPAEKLAEWASAVPEEFRFLVKAPAHCTSPRDPNERGSAPNPYYLDPEFATDAIVGPAVTGLASKLGVIVFQFPPLTAAIRSRPEKFAEDLHRFLCGLPSGPPYAVEIRDRVLWTRAFAQSVVDAGASPCFSVHPRVPAIDEQLALADGLPLRTLAVRWMLHPGLDFENAVRRYAPFTALVDEDPKSRSTIAELCRNRLAEGKEALVIANNKAEGSAPLTLFALARLLAGSARNAP